MKTRYHTQPRILFIVKRREDPVLGYSTSMESGLRTSVLFLLEMLTLAGITAKLAEVTDNNDIDREVNAFKPSVVVIEAFWVVPEKFDVLARLHPTVRWVVRGHSELPFLATEGIAIQWLIDYIKHPNVSLAANTEQARQDFIAVLRATYPAVDEVVIEQKVLYLPNWYPATALPAAPMRHHLMSAPLHIGCFGAIRVLKNHLIQAVSALRFGEEINRAVHFHVNTGRVEGPTSDPIMRSLESLFAKTPWAMLVKHPWMSREDYLNVLEGMDIHMQCSLTETFNIVTADAVSLSIPVVVSREVFWLDERFYSDPNSSDSILRGLRRAYYSNQGQINHQLRCLVAWDMNAEAVWLSQLG